MNLSGRDETKIGPFFNLLVGHIASLFVVWKILKNFKKFADSMSDTSMSGDGNSQFNQWREL